MADEQDATEEQEDLIALFFSESDASAEDKQALDHALNVAPSDTHINTWLRRLVLKLADWCYEIGYEDGEAGRR